MIVLVIGATGYVGSVVTEHLTAAGHDVVALTRSTAAAPGSRHGDLADPASLAAAVAPDIDAVVHLGAPADAATDLAAIDALVEPLRGTGRALIYTSGTWVLGPTGARLADEDDPTNPIDIVAHRPEVERRVLTADGVRGVVIRPGVVHGRGGGIPALLVGWAAEHGGGRYVGRTDARWPMVHVDDLARLYVAALECARPGTVWHGVSEEAVPVPALAGAAARAVGVAGPATALPLAEARIALGTPFADALALGQSVSGARARRQLGWRPSQESALDDVAAGSYVGIRVP